MPTSFGVQQNYPNPFIPSTAIEFALSKAGLVMLKIWLLLGEQGAKLVAEKRMAGVHKVNWDASGLASGAYVYRLEAGDPSTGSGQSFVQTKKLLLIR